MKQIYTAVISMLICTFSTQTLFAQLPGLINRQATSAGGRLILDPNGDGYTSATTAGFSSNDVTQSEISFQAIRAYSMEPYSDLRRGPNHAYSDFVPDSSGNGVYHHFSAAQNLLFRMRMGRIMPGSKGYSILMDTDGKFGATGANADPNYLPSTTGTNGNPGFEIEIVLETNFRIAIYNVDGTSSPVLVKQYTNWQDMSQVSIAATNDDGDPDFLIDFYIPFSDLQAAPFNLTASSSIRMSATTVMSPQAATGGPRSDIYGTAGDSYEDFIIGQPPCQLFNTPANCPTAMCTAAPLVNSPINTGTVNISGTWTKSALPAAASTATITVYKNGVSIGTVTNVTTGSAWTLNNIALVNGDVITARAQAVNESLCLLSNAVAASTCNSSNIPATPILSCLSGSKGIDGTNLSTGWRVHVDNLTRNVLDNSETNTTSLFGATTGTSPNISWTFSGGCSTGAPLNSGSYKVYYVNIATGCASAPVYFCAAGNGGTALAGTLAVPVITSPANSVFTTAVQTISGTTDAGASVKLYINGINVQTVTATGGTFSFTNLNLLNGQQLYIVTELNTGTVATSKCANQTALFTVTCFTKTPVINIDNNSQLAASSPITGTSTEPVGTTIRVYTSTNTLVATTTVQANGTWSTGNAGTTPATYNAVAGTGYYVNAQNGSCGLSGNTATFTAAPATSNARCGAITGPVAASATSISGTLTGSFTTSTVNLYLDGQLIGTTTTNNATWGPITVNSAATNTLYPNGVLSIGVQESGKQEVVCPATLTIACSPTPSVPTYSPAVTSVQRNQTVTYTISNAMAGTFYAVSDSTTGQSLGMGKWAVSNGSLMITTTPFTTAGTFKVLIKSTSLSGVTLCSNVSGTGTVTVSSIALPLNLVRFKGRKLPGGNLLEWVTANEANTSRFEIERSGDGSTYISLNSVAASGNSSTNKSYSFTDQSPLAQVNYYRLKMIDQDGSFTYSHVVVINTTGTAVDIINKIAPNPFSSSISIDVNLSRQQNLAIQLVDLAGRVVATRTFPAIAGDNNILFDELDKLSPGIYFIRIITSEGILQQKLLKTSK
jgi:Secretion system C-terminal sorting domain